MYRILVVADSRDASTHTAVLQPFEHLARHGILEYNVKSSKSVEPVDVAVHDVIVVQRSIEPSLLQILVWTRKYNKGLIYDLDDNFFSIEDTGQPPGTYYNRPIVKQIVTRIAAGADLVRAASRQLAEALTPVARRVVFRRNAIDLGLIDSFGPRPQGPSPLIIGYSGTPKVSDFQMVLPALQRLLNERPGALELDFMGFIPQELIGHPSISFVPFEFNYSRYLYNLWSRGWHVGIAPLQDHQFNRCKTDIKFREYGALGIPGVYSRLPNYEECIQDGISGLLADNHPYSWYPAIRRLLDAPNLREQVARNARSWVVQNNSIEKVAAEWRGLLQEFFSFNS
ncbi:MAG: glycosyltransferase [Clostridia bacterium]|nr:glycosyltransferase [Clostridia bacterium]